MALFCLAATSLFALWVISERALYVLRSPISSVPPRAQGSGPALLTPIEVDRLGGPCAEVVRAALAAADSGRDAVVRAVHGAVLEHSPREWARLEWTWLCAHLALLLGVIFVLPGVGAHLSAVSTHAPKTSVNFAPLLWGAGVALVCGVAHGLFRARAKVRLARLDRFALELIARWPERSEASGQQAIVRSEG